MPCGRKDVGVQGARNPESWKAKSTSEEKRFWKDSPELGFHPQAPVTSERLCLHLHFVCDWRGSGAVAVIQEGGGGGGWKWREMSKVKGIWRIKRLVMHWIQGGGGGEYREWCQCLTQTPGPTWCSVPRRKPVRKTSVKASRRRNVHLVLKWEQTPPNQSTGPVGF